MIGIGIDTARYGHRVTFLRDDKQPAAPAMDVLESREGYESLRHQLDSWHNDIPKRSSMFGWIVRGSTLPT